MKLPIHSSPKNSHLNLFSPEGPFWDKDLFSDWMPKVDVSETKNDYIIRAALPNVKPEDIDIEIDEHMLTIQGKTETQKVEEDGTWYRRECESGSFSRTLSIPKNADIAHVTAQNKHGSVEIRLPKTKESQKKKISLQ